jgi:uncharacterized glyoxalase superfamily protein PhnB
MAGGLPAVVPMLSYEDAGAAADWLATAFGFRELERYADEDGRVTHVTLEHGGHLVMVGWPGEAYRSPRSHALTCDEARTWSEVPYVIDGVLVIVDDIDEHFRRAREHGATVLSDVEDNVEIGQRQYRAADPEGHRWMFAQPM